MYPSRPFSNGPAAIFRPAGIHGWRPDPLHPTADAEAIPILLQVAAGYWSAPLPPPNVLADYNKAYPSCAQEIVDMARTQSTHRQYVEKTVIDGDVKRADRGQILGFLVAMTIVLVGGALLWHGRSITGLITLVGGMTGLVGIFVYARRREDKELADKRRALAGPPQPVPPQQS